MKWRRTRSTYRKTKNKKNTDYSCHGVCIQCPGIISDMRRAMPMAKYHVYKYINVDGFHSTIYLWLAMIKWALTESMRACYHISLCKNTVDKLSRNTPRMYTHTHYSARAPAFQWFSPAVSLSLPFTFVAYSLLLSLVLLSEHAFFCIYCISVPRKTCVAGLLADIMFSCSLTKYKKQDQNIYRHFNISLNWKYFLPSHVSAL